MTELFLKKNTLNLVSNPTFYYADRDKWMTMPPDAGNQYFDIEQSNVLHYIRYGDSYTTGSYVVRQEDIGLITYANYIVKLKVSNMYRANSSLDNLGIFVKLGDTISAVTIDADGNYEFELQAGEGDFIEIISSSESNEVRFDINYIQVFKKDALYQIDLLQNVPLQITNQVSDVREFATRKGAYSQSITIPATDNNNQVFGHIGTIGTQSRFNPAKKTEIFILQDGIQIFEGNLQFMNAKRNNEIVTEYEIKISSNVKDIRDDWDTKTFSHLDLSELNHLYTKENIVETLSQNYKLNGSTTSYIEVGTVKYFTDTFYNSSTLSTTGLLGLQFSTAHGLNKWETINVSLEDNSSNPSYEQWWTIVDVPSSTTIVLNKGFGNSTISEGGSCYKVNCNGQGYTYGRIHRGDIGALSYEVENYKPNTNVYYLLTKMFNQFGYTFSSETLNTAFFKNLYLEHSFENAKRYNYKNLSDYFFQASQTGSNFLTYYETDGRTVASPVEEVIYIDDDSTPPNFDGVQNNFNPSAYAYQPTEDIYMRLTVTGHVTNEGYPTYTSPTTDPYMINLTNSTHKYGVYSKTYIRLYERFISGGTPILLNTVIVESDKYFDDVEERTGITTFSDEDFLLENETVYKVGYEYYVTCQTIWWNQEFNDSGEYFGPEYEIVTDDGLIFFGTGSNSLTKNNMDSIIELTVMKNERDVFIKEGDLIDFSTILPTDIKLIDFFDSICKKFNLYYQLEGSKNYRIETYDTFYQQGNLIDWTGKADINNAVVTPTAALQAQKIVFKDTPGVDFWNEQTVLNIVKDSEGNDRQYGQYEIITDNQWNKDTKTITTIFSPTVITDRKGDTSNRGYYEDYEVLPRIIAKLDSTDKPEEGLRLLYFNRNYTDYNYTIHSKFENATYTYEVYNSLSHVDNKSIPTIDLNWGSPALTWFVVDKWTDNNIYNKFYYNYIQDLISADTKLLTIKVYLSPADYQNLDMRDIIIIDNQRFRINKVLYTTSGNVLSDVELISY